MKHVVTILVCSVALIWIECACFSQEKQLNQEQVLEAMSLTAQAFRNATDAVRPSLVTIESFGGVSAVQGKIGGIRKQGEGNSTGLLLTSDGILITSTFNFIQRPPVITVITADGERRVASLLGQDDTRKLCLLKIEGVKDLPVPEFVDPKTLEVGQWAVSVGVGYGDTNPAISMGIISATNRVGGRAVQTDANISPANYGGPLIDIEGRVIGICVPMHPQSQAIGAGVEWYDSGIGFAIPLFDAEKLLDRLKQGERIFPAFLGVRPVPNESGDGVLIEEAISSAPAAEAGLMRGDCILKLAGEDVNDVMTLKQILNRFEAGQEIKVVYRSYEKEKSNEITVVLSAPPQPKGQPEQMEPPKIR